MLENTDGKPAALLYVYTSEPFVLPCSARYPPNECPVIRTRSILYLEILLLTSSSTASDTCSQAK